MMTSARYLLFIFDLIVYPVVALLVVLPETPLQLLITLLCAMAFYTLHKGLMAAIHLIYDHGIHRLSSARLRRGYWRLYTRHK